MYCGYWTTPLLLFVSIYDYYLGYVFYSTCKTSWKSHTIIGILFKSHTSKTLCRSFDEDYIFNYKNQNCNFQRNNRVSNTQL